MSEPDKLYHADLYPFQTEGVAQCYLRPTNLVVWDTGTGKALRSDQRISTPQGWRQIGDLSVGDRVFGIDGKSHQVTGVYPQGQLDLWKVTFGDGVEVVCSRDHLWEVTNAHQRNLGRDPWVITIEEMMRRGLSVSQPGHKSSGRRWKFYVPIAEPVQYPELPLPVHPYTLGALIGDGGLTQAVILSSGDEELIEHLVLPDELEIRDEFQTKQRWRIVAREGCRNVLLDAIREMGLNTKSELKRIPPDYLKGSVDQRWEMLCGLMDTDGWVDASLNFSSSSRGLTEDVIELVRSLGGTASGPHLKTTSHLDHWVTRFVLPTGQCPFKLGRKRDMWNPRRGPTRPVVDIQKIESGEAICIAVDGPRSLYLTEGFVATHNTHLTMATAALLFEDDLIDMVFVVCEKNKLDEWVEDFGRYTDLDVGKYHGSRRSKVLEADPQVLVTTYETARNDAVRLVEVEGRKSKKMTPGPLLEGLTGKRVVIAYDEMTKLGGSRTSGNHKHHAFLIKELRGNGEMGEYPVRAIGLTATPIERSPENIYNLGRILSPDLMPTVADFTKNYIKTFDLYGNPSVFKNLTPDDMEDRVTPFVDLIKPFMIRKRKTDPDVIDQFPSTVEEVTYVEMSKKHSDFYDAVIEIFDDDDPKTEAAMFTLLRMISGHPASLMRSTGQIAQAIVGEVGEAGLREIGSAKLDRLVEYLVPLVEGQGAQCVVFTYFGPSMIPLIEEALVEKGLSVATNHGQMRDSDRKADKAAFKAGEKSVFLTSDAGARGINLPEALYVVEYDMALQHSLRIQRVNRIHRIDSKHPSVTFQTFIHKDTVEDGPITRLVNKRNQWSDDLIDYDVSEEEDFTSAELRKALMKRARERVS